MRRLILLLMLLPGALAAQTVTSPGPDKVSVTVYRAPGREAKQPMRLEWLQGYALITETRTITIPAGDATIRFEGVAGGILPESAIVTGLPSGVREKNQDADLLSPRALLAASAERRVTVRRTNRATGAVREHDAVLRSGPDGAVVMQTAEGFEALKCTGLNETIVYDSVPVGLSAKPTLSVRTESSQAAQATLTLSYLAQGFDWQANYVATLGDDNRTIDLFAWVTLASGDETSFADADTQAVAGKVNRQEQRQGVESTPGYIQFRCWPYGNTGEPGDYEDQDAGGFGALAPPPPPPPAPPMAMAVAEDIVVTGQRVSRKAVQEELGDLKLYRIPQPVTVAANSQKQVTMIDTDGVPAAIFYRARITDGEASGPVIMVRLQNRKEDRLGIPLPAGPVAIFQEARDRPMLLGEAAIEDKAIGEEVEFVAAMATSVSVEVDRGAIDKAGARTDTVTVSNANDRPIAFEAEFLLDPEQTLSGFSKRTKNVDGKIRWPVTIPANGRAVLTYRSQALPEPDA
jgi:hypothetical protein